MNCKVIPIDILLSMRIRLIRSTLTQIQSSLFAIIRPTTPCKFKVFLVSYPDSNIGDSLYTINYDYNHSVDDLIAKALKEDLTRSFEDCMKYVYRQAMKNSGITFNTSSSACYDFKGNYLSPVPSMSGDASYYSPIFHVANYIFYKYYDDYFLPINKF